ncbi:hypothetical protein S245_037230, partial [Arachis hypogaea]
SFDGYADDGMAIMMPFQCPEVEVLGFTTIFGNVATTDAIQNALLLCEIAGRQNLPVAEGSPDPLKLLLAIGTKLEHVIMQLAHEVVEKHAAIEDAFEIAFFFWIWVTYGFDSCIMGQVRCIVPRLIIGYSTLPLYAIVTQ